MSKKGAALIGLGVAIGVFAMVASWWLAVAIPDDSQYCRVIGSVILDDYHRLLSKEDVETTELVMRSLMINMDRWEMGHCDSVIQEMAPTINEVLDVLER